jgi:hypothetical protein
VAGGPGGKICGRIVVLVNVKAWKREKMVYGKRATNSVLSGTIIACDIERKPNWQLALKTTKTSQARSIGHSAHK